MSQIHDTYETPEKVLARAEGVKIYRRLSGRFSIPQDRSYVSLCARQTDSPESEINQVLSLGVITSKSQFVGIEMRADLIEYNKATHPNAVWIHQTSTWQRTLLDFDAFNPSLIYLDTESLAGRLTLNMLAATMPLCPPETLILLNVMAKNPYNGTASLVTGDFVRELVERVPDIADWVPSEGVTTFTYQSYKTPMTTFAFYRAAAMEAA